MCSVACQWLHQGTYAVRLVAVDHSVSISWCCCFAIGSQILWEADEPVFLKKSVEWRRSCSLLKRPGLRRFC